MASEEVKLFAYPLLNELLMEIPRGIRFQLKKLNKNKKITIYTELVEVLT